MIFSFNLLKTPALTHLRHLTLKNDSSHTFPGLTYAESMLVMELGSPVFSPKRFQLGKLAMFAAWEDEDALDDYLATDPLGTKLADGWHVRMNFARRWGSIAALPELPTQVGDQDPDRPVVAVTLARMKHTQVPRFIHWRRPVERLVRDHPGQTLALAGMHPVRTVSTFSVWKSQREMTDMVRGHSDIPEPARHADAMSERNRKDFHFEFTTLRFDAISEHGSWMGRTNIVPGLAQN